MSIDVMTWVFRNSETTGNDRLVLLAIADEADDDGTNAFPSIDRIASKARLNKRTTMRCLQRLEEANALIVHRPEQRGRGHFNTYVVVLDVADRSGDRVSPFSAQERARKGAQRRAVVRDPSQTHRPTDFDFESDETSPRVVASSASSQNDDGDDEIDVLCAQLADAIERHREGDRPKITKRWHDDMRKLIQRGPLHVDDPQPLDAEHVSLSIRVLFDELAERGKDGFCWADQIRSPHALRDHWVQLREARRRQSAGRKSRGGQAIDRVAKRMGATERAPLGLLKGGGT